MPSGPLYPVGKQPGTFECWRCNFEVTSATKRELEDDGWRFIALRGPTRKTKNHGLAGGKLTAAAHAGEFALCGECAVTMEAIWRMRDPA